MVIAAAMTRQNKIVRCDTETELMNIKKILYGQIEALDAKKELKVRK